MVRSRKLHVLMASFVVAIGISTVGCSSQDSGSSDETPAEGGELVIARAEEGKSLDPARAISPAEIAPINQIFDRLFTVSADGLSLVPSVATAATPSKDGTEWEIEIRDDVEFTDGSPLTADDVKFSLDRSRTATGGFSFLLAPIASIDVTGDYSLVIRTEEPSATLLPGLSSWVASIVPADLGGESDRQFFEAPVGSGPFVFDSWDRGQSIRLTKNGTYWQTGKPLLDAVQWNTVPDESTRVSQVQSGQADVADSVPFSQVSTLDATDLNAQSFPANYTTFLIFNEEYEPFADVHVRRAIAYAVDRQAITAGALFGAGEPACSMVPPSMPYSSEPDCLGFDLEAAKDELAKSAWPNGFDVELTTDNLPVTSSVAQIVQSELAEIGINVKIKVVDAGQLYTTYGQQAYQMGFAAWASDIPDPDEQLSYMLDPAAGGNAYYTGWSDPEVSRLITEGRETLNSDERAEIYAQIQQIAAEQLPQLPISNQENPYVWTQDVQDFWVNPMGQMDLVNMGLTRVGVSHVDPSTAEVDRGARPGSRGHVHVRTPCPG